MSSTTTLLDLRRDAITLVCETQAREIIDLAYEDVIEENEVTFLGENTDDEDRWEGIFSHSANAEKLYQVTYRYDAEQFFVTTFIMLSCDKVDAPYLN